MAETSGAERLRRLFAATAAEGRAALLPFMTAGLPDPASSARLFEAMADAGADGFEVGIPYSDPLMDGPVIQEAGARALRAGTSLERGIGIVAEVVARTAKPVVVMTYVNPILAMGADRFAQRAAAAGASGVIVADLPADEAGDIQGAASAHGLGTVLFAAPTTDDERLRSIAAAEPVFIYGIAELGVTGERVEASSRAATLALRVRAITDVPLVLGVGISTPEHARAAAGAADGVIVGSALVRRVLDAASVDDACVALYDAVSALAAAVRR